MCLTAACRVKWNGNKTRIFAFTFEKCLFRYLFLWDESARSEIKLDTFLLLFWASRASHCHTMSEKSSDRLNKVFCVINLLVTPAGYFLDHDLAEFRHHYISTLNYSRSFFCSIKSFLYYSINALFYFPQLFCFRSMHIVDDIILSSNDFYVI